MPNQAISPPELDKLGANIKRVMAAGKPSGPVPTSTAANLRRKFKIDENGQFVEVPDTD